MHDPMSKCDVMNNSQREMEAAKRISIIVAFFMVSTLPLETLNFLNSVFNFDFEIESLTQAAILISHLKPVVNPMLYVYHLKDFRSAVLELFQKRSNGVGHGAIQMSIIHSRQSASASKNNSTVTSTVKQDE